GTRSVTSRRVPGSSSGSAGRSRSRNPLAPMLGPRRRRAARCRPRAPAADGVLEDAPVVEGALTGIELRVLPDRAEAIRAATGRGAGREVDRGSVVRLPGDVEHLLLRRTRGVEPTLHDLDALQRG